MASINNDKQDEANNICNKIFSIYQNQSSLPYFAIEIDDSIAYETVEDMDEIKEQVEYITHNLDDYLKDEGFAKDEVETIRIYYYGYGEPQLIHTIYEKEE